MSGRRLLVVDDDMQMVRTLCDILALEGWDTVGVHSGQAALEAVGREPFDAVLMDVRMPGINGVDTFRAMRRARPELRVMLMTAYAASELLAEAEREGVLRVFPKPVDLAALMALLQERPGRVLVVDDDPEYLRTLTDILENEGLQVLRAQTVEAALDQLAGPAPAVVVLDLVLNGMEPRAAIAAIREASPGVLFILYSGHAAVLDDTAAAVPTEWVGACFHKPFDVQRLLGALRALGV